MLPKIKILTTILLFTFPISHALAQLVHPAPVSYRSNFENFYFTNADSALFYAKKLAEKPEYASFLKQALHTSFYPVFIEVEKQAAPDEANKAEYEKSMKEYDEQMAICHSTLEKLYQDSNPRLVESIKPLYLWTEIQRNLADKAKIQQLVNSFVTTQFENKDTYANKSATYALLIYRTMTDKTGLQGIADSFLDETINTLTKNQTDINVNQASDSLLKKRAYSRFVLATANYLKANRLAKTQNSKTALVYFQAAADKSPDLTDRGESGEYFIEKSLFANKNADFYNDEYIKNLKSSEPDKKKLLATLSTLALRNPGRFKKELDTFYNASFPNQGSFSEYWTGQINTTFANVPAFKVKTLKGKTYTNGSAKKWLLIDFWGTWCGPCVEEHPDVQKLYSDTQSDQSNVELLTIACGDTQDKVDSYMDKHKYTFPVAMADKEITKIFNVHGYPTKVLISPQGKYLVIPFAIDWRAFVNQYVSL